MTRDSVLTKSGERLLTSPGTDIVSERYLVCVVFHKLCYTSQIDSTGLGVCRCSFGLPRCGVSSRFLCGTTLVLSL